MRMFDEGSTIFIGGSGNTYLSMDVYFNARNYIFMDPSDLKWILFISSYFCESAPPFDDFLLL